MKKDKAYEIAKLRTKLRHLKLCGVDRGRNTSGRDWRIQLKDDWHVNTA